MSTTDTINGQVSLDRSALGSAFARIFSFPVLLGAFLILCVFAWARLLSHDPDMWWHIAIGQAILEDRAFPEFDTYSWTAAGTHWIAYEWLGEVLIAAATRGGDLIAQKLLLLTIAGILFLLLFYYAYLRSRNYKAAFVACIVLSPLAVFFFTLRPQLLGYVFLLVTLICLERYRQQESCKVLWALPPLFLLWVNTHGSFAFGLFVIGLYWICGLVHFTKGGLRASRWRPPERLRLALVIFLCVIAATITPYGTRLAAYPLEMALFQSVNVGNIIEWLPVGTDLWFGKVFVGLLLVFFLVQVVLRENFWLHEMGLLLFAVFSASLHRRFLIVFLIVFAPLLATMLARWVKEYSRANDKPSCNAVLILVITGMIIWFFPSQRHLENVAAQDYPVEAVKHIRSRPIEGRLFNDYGWGGYLIWSLHPEQKVFIDGRADIYEYSGVLPEYLSIIRIERDALALLRKYNVQACLVRRKEAISSLLAASPEWEQTYADELSAIFVRTNIESPVLSAGGESLRVEPGQNDLRHGSISTVAKR